MRLSRKTFGEGEELARLLSRQILAELKRPADKLAFGLLYDIARADKEIAELMAATVLEKIESKPDLPVEALAPALDVVLRGKNHNVAVLRRWL